MDGTGMKGFVLAIALCSLFPVPCSPVHASATWNEEKGDHFIVYHEGSDAFAKDVKYKAEVYYNRIANDLGYARHTNFWSWENRVKIYIHPDAAAFRRATGQPEWSHGMANYFGKEIHTILGEKDFLDSVLPHEITHLIFRDFVGFKGEVPLWLDEGVAQWEEETKRAEALKVMPQVVLAGYAMTLKKLMMTDIRSEKDPKRVAAFYMQAISVVDYLVREHGTSSFTLFCRELRDGKSLEQALRSAYPAKMANLEDLENKWIKHVMQ